MKNKSCHVGVPVTVRRFARHGNQRLLVFSQRALVRVLATVSIILYLGAGLFGQEVPRVLSYQGRVTSGGVNFNGTGQFKFALLAPSGSGVFATANVTSGFVTSVIVNTAGSGYIAAPVVKFSGGGGTGAAATATISGGTVAAIAVTSPGSGYTSPPTVSFETAEEDYALVWKNDGSTDVGEPTKAVGINVTKGLFSARLGDTSFPNMSAIADGVLRKAPLRLRVWFNDGVKGSQQLGQDVVLARSAYAFNGELESKDLVVSFIETLNGISDMPFSLSYSGYGVNQKQGFIRIPSFVKRVNSITFSAKSSNSYLGVVSFEIKAGAASMFYSQTTPAEAPTTYTVPVNLNVDPMNPCLMLITLSNPNNYYGSGARLDSLKINVQAAIP